MSAAAFVHPPEQFWDHQAATLPDTAADWLLPGFIAHGNLTLLTSLWKAGKTTLLTHLLARRNSGQPLFGLPVVPGKTVVVTEEPRGLWTDRCRQCQFGGRVLLIPQPFADLPTREQWRGLMEHVGRLRQEHGFDLLVVDSLTHFLRAENNNRGVQDLIMPVRQLTACGMAALFMHHPRRKGAGHGIAGRGHGAVHTEVDISIEMRHAGGNVDSRARRFFCMSRHAATPRHFLFELNGEGTDYVVLPTAAADDEGFGEHWDVLRGVLEDAEQKLTRYDILDEWPDDFAKPHAGTLAKWLQCAIAARLVEIEGAGKKADPYRYWLASAEERWRAQRPFYDVFEKQRRDLKLPYESLRERKRTDEANRRWEDDLDEPLKPGEKLWPPGSAEE